MIEIQVGDGFEVNEQKLPTTTIDKINARRKALLIGNRSDPALDISYVHAPYQPLYTSKNQP